MQEYSCSSILNLRSGFHFGITSLSPHFILFYHLFYIIIIIYYTCLASSYHPDLLLFHQRTRCLHHHLLVWSVHHSSTFLYYEGASPLSKPHDWGFAPNPNLNRWLFFWKKNQNPPGVAAQGFSFLVTGLRPSVLHLFKKKKQKELHR